MNNNVTNSLTIFLFISFLCSCSSCKKKERVDFTIDLVTTINIDGGTDNKLPETLHPIYYPIENENCNTQIFVPTGKIKRIDFTNKVDVIVKDEENASTWVQKKTSGQTTKMIKDNMIKSLKEISIKGLQDNVTHTKEEQLISINNFLKQNNNYDSIIVYSNENKGEICWKSFYIIKQNKQVDTIWKSYQLFHSVDTIQKFLNLMACEKPKCKILIIFNPPSIANEQQDFTSDPTNPPAKPAVPPTPPIQPVIKPDIQEEYNKPPNNENGTHKIIPIPLSPPKFNKIKINLSGNSFYWNTVGNGVKYEVEILNSNKPPRKIETESSLDKTRYEINTNNTLKFKPSVPYSIKVVAYNDANNKKEIIDQAIWSFTIDESKSITLGRCDTTYKN